jgi:hypothetical protein
MPTSDDERAEKILRQLNRIPDRPRARHGYAWFIILTAAILLGATGFVILTNRERFGLLYQHMAHPDSVPGAGQ